MIPLRIGAIASAAALSLGLGLGWKIGHARGEAAMEREIQRVRTAAVSVIDRTTAERDQCRGEVGKVNESILRLQAAIFDELKASDARRAKATEQNSQAARRAADQAARAIQAAATLQERIANVADECARAGVDPESVRLLNDIAGAASGLDDR